jgi:hypothetical protein
MTMPYLINLYYFNTASLLVLKKNEWHLAALLFLSDDRALLKNCRK